LIVLRLLTGLLFIMLGTILVRYLVWGAVWLLTGSHFWILPNLMSETVSQQWVTLLHVCGGGVHTKLGGVLPGVSPHLTSLPLPPPHTRPNT
jgi:hypothetical protein